MSWVFSYGSNSAVQLRGRVKNPSLVAYPAIALNWERMFCWNAGVWGYGGVGTLGKCECARTYGAAVRLNAEELSLLDSFELPRYERVELEAFITLEDGEIRTTSFVYISVDPTWHVPPTEQYLTAIHLMLREQFPGNDDVLKIDVKGLFNETSKSHHVYTWNHPGSHSLTLASMCVEVNALRSGESWVMPRTINTILKKLAAIDIHSASQFAVCLSTDEGTAQLQAKLEANLFPAFSNDTIQCFRTVMGLKGPGLLQC